MKLFATLFFFISFSTLAADCQRSARREAQDVFGREAQVQASLSQGIGDELFASFLGSAKWHASSAKAMPTFVTVEYSARNL
jgi:hypothetical protein